jgi:hypothetical protein
VCSLFSGRAVVVARRGRESGLCRDETDSTRDSRRRALGRVGAARQSRDQEGGQGFAINRGRVLRWVGGQRRRLDSDFCVQPWGTQSAGGVLQWWRGGRARAGTHERGNESEERVNSGGRREWSWRAVGEGVFLDERASVECCSERGRTTRRQD